MQSAVDELNPAMAAQVQGGTAATAVKNNKREAVVTLLRELTHYVHDNCGNDPAVLLSRVFSWQPARDRYPLAKPSIVSIDSGLARKTEFWTCMTAISLRPNIKRRHVRRQNQERPSGQGEDHIGGPRADARTHVTPETRRQQCQLSAICCGMCNGLVS